MDLGLNFQSPFYHKIGVEWQNSIEKIKLQPKHITSTNQFTQTTILIIEIFPCDKRWETLPKRFNLVIDRPGVARAVLQKKVVIHLLIDSLLLCENIFKTLSLTKRKTSSTNL